MPIRCAGRPGATRARPCARSCHRHRPVARAPHYCRRVSGSSTGLPRSARAPSAGSSVQHHTWWPRWRRSERLEREFRSSLRSTRTHQTPPRLCTTRLGAGSVPCPDLSRARPCGEGVAITRLARAAADSATLVVEGDDGRRVPLPSSPYTAAISRWVVCPAGQCALGFPAPGIDRLSSHTTSARSFVSSSTA